MREPFLLVDLTFYATIHFCFADERYIPQVTKVSGTSISRNIPRYKGYVQSKYMLGFLIHQTSRTNRL
jgi:hypothetical protein